MKNYKNLLSMILSIFLVLSSLGTLSVFATEETTDVTIPDPVFDLDISGFDPVNKTVENNYGLTNKGTDQTFNLDVMNGTNGTTEYNSFASNSFINKNGEKVPYIDFLVNRRNASDYGSRIWIDNASLQTKSYSAEFWVRSQYYNYGPIATVYGGQNSTHDASLTDKVTLTRHNFSYRSSLTNGTGNAGSVDVYPLWWHVVITRSVTGDAETGYTAKYDGYVKGTHVWNSANQSLLTNSVSTDAAALAGMVLGTWGKGTSYALDTLQFSAARIYDSVLSLDQIKLLYSGDYKNKYTPEYEYKTKDTYNYDSQFADSAVYELDIDSFDAEKASTSAGYTTTANGITAEYKNSNVTWDKSSTVNSGNTGMKILKASNAKTTWAAAGNYGKFTGEVLKDPATFSLWIDPDTMRKGYQVARHNCVASMGLTYTTADGETETVATKGISVVYTNRESDAISYWRMANGLTQNPDATAQTPGVSNTTAYYGVAHYNKGNEFLDTKGMQNLIITSGGIQADNTCKFVCYVDGRYRGTYILTIPDGATVTGGQIRIGDSLEGFGYPTDISLADAKIFNKAFDGNEARALYDLERYDYAARVAVIEGTQRTESSSNNSGYFNANINLGTDKYLRNLTIKSHPESSLDGLTLIIGEYDAAGNLLAAEMLNLKGASQTYTMQNTAGYGNISTYKIFIWDGETMMPYTELIEKGVTVTAN